MAVTRRRLPGGRAGPRSARASCGSPTASWTASSASSRPQRRLADRAAAARRPALLTHGGLRRHRARWRSASASPRASGATLVVEPDEDHFGHLDPDEPVVEGGDRMALTRDDAMRLDDADPLAGFRDRFVITDEHRLYLDGNSLGRLPKGTRERLHRVIDQWGDELVERLAGVDRGADAHRRRAGRGARREPGRRCSSPTAPRSTSTSSSTRCSTRDPTLRTLATDADNFPTDRYVLEGIARARGLELKHLRDRRPAERAAAATRSPTAWSCSRTSPTAPARWPTWRRSTRRR